jgi:hypothetical protein
MKCLCTSIFLVRHFVGVKNQTDVTEQIMCNKNNGTVRLNLVYF